MDIAFDHIIMHQTINDIVCLVFCRTNNEGIRQEVPHVDKGIGTHPLVLPKILARVASMEGIDSDLELLAMAGCVHEPISMAVDVGKRQVIHELHDPMYWSTVFWTPSGLQLCGISQGTSLFQADLGRGFVSIRPIGQVSLS
jgi:hypothetical protein